MPATSDPKKSRAQSQVSGYDALVLIFGAVPHKERLRGEGLTV